ncbi:MAG: primosomal protein N' [Lautropia sp.]|nr:primosomal protein N' [Lautropia sp.]
MTIPSPVTDVYVQVLIDGPLAGSFIYRCPPGLKPPRHQWVTVPWGKGRRTGLAIGPCEASTLPSDLKADSIRDLEAVRDDLPALPESWLSYLGFVVRYYHGKLADLALGSLPKPLKTPPTERTRLDARKRLAAFATTPALPETGRAVTGTAAGTSNSHRNSNSNSNAETATNTSACKPPLGDTAHPDPCPENPLQSLSVSSSARHAGHTLNTAQQAVLDALCQDTEAKPRPWLLHGITGSGKTEVYLHWMAHVLSQSPTRQVLLLVPEIGLTPAVLRQLQQRFPQEPIAVLHSEMTDTARASHWLAAISGKARIILGTRLAILAPLPRLAAIIIDEEHDPSYKQQEGLRYSARDMAVARANLGSIPILLGSATPSMESWHNARTGRYRLLSMTQRASRHATLPRIRTVPLRGAKLREGLTEEAITAIQQTLARQEQVLIYLNRRGYAPVLGCDACGWLSRCDRCDAYRVLHRQSGAQTTNGPRRYQLICHHCGSTRPAPRACPDCGNQDLAPLGRGTQKLEDALVELFPTARIGRLDRDVAKKRGATQAFLAAAHAGETDLLVGTQMLTKGHDFDRLTLVIVVDADAGLFTADFRAPERLFATLMQVAGRAGRHRSEHAQTLIQTRHPEHPLFDSLRRHDYPSFATDQLAEREAGALPPFGYQALIQVQARHMDQALAFLNDVREHLLLLIEAHERGKTPLFPPSPTRHPKQTPATGKGLDTGQVPPPFMPMLSICDPVPMPLAQINKVSRAQLLIESDHRQSLHALLARLQHWLNLPRPKAASRSSRRSSPQTRQSASDRSQPLDHQGQMFASPPAGPSHVRPTAGSGTSQRPDDGAERLPTGEAIPPTHRFSSVRWQLIVDPLEI